MNLVELTEYLVNTLVNEPASVILSESNDDMSVIKNLYLSQKTVMQVWTG